MTEIKTLDHPLIEDLIDEIVEARRSHLQSKIRPQSKRPYMYLSDVHRCTRHNYYSMIEGDKRRPITDWLQALFDSGNVWESETVRELLAMRFEVIAGQQVIELKYSGKREKHRGEVMGKGKIDGMVRYKGESFPMEIKSLGENTYRNIKTVDDLFKSEMTEKYLRQLLMYLYGNNKETGFFLINDRSGHWNPMAVYLGNYIDYCDRVIKNMEAAWEAKIDSKEPDRINYQHKVCGRCQFGSVCCPETILEGGAVIDDPEMEAGLALHEDLKPKHDRYKELHEDYKELFKDKPQTTIGHFIVTPKMTERRGSIKVSELPGKLQKQLEKYRGKPTQSWSFTVDDINKKPESDA